MRLLYVIAVVALLLGSGLNARAEGIVCSADSLAEPDLVIKACSLIVDSEIADRPARLAALLARAQFYKATEKPDLAIADYTAALKLDPVQPATLNARGVLRRAAGDRPRALMDFNAALRMKPDFAAARDNRKSLAQEIERIGAEMAIGRKPASPANAPLK